MSIFLKDKFVMKDEHTFGTYKKIWKSSILEDLITLSLIIISGALLTLFFLTLAL